MDKNQIKPERITKPIQLLGAWLVGLLAIDASFLFAATNLDLNTWHAGALVIAAILNVPVFIGALFLLQTKFRPELQEDSYYSTYLNNRTNELIKVPKKDQLFESIEKRLEKIEASISSGSAAQRVTPLSELAYGVNFHLSNQAIIEEELSKLGVKVFREFGHEADAPDGLKVAIASHLTSHQRNEVLELARKLGFQYYSIIEPWEEDIEEDVLFGSYGDVAGRIAATAA
jgi:hypothetical protein